MRAAEGGDGPVVNDGAEEHGAVWWRLGVVLLGLVQAALLLSNLAPWPASAAVTLLPVGALALVAAVSRDRAPGRWWFALPPLNAAAVVALVLVGTLLLDSPPAMWWMGCAVVAAIPAVVVATTARSVPHGTS